jgi:hypothetical protein
VTTYRYFFSFKSYEIYDFEDLYLDMRGRAGEHRVGLFNQKKEAEPHRYYFQIIKYLSEQFPGVHFEYKLRKKVLDSEEYRVKAERTVKQRCLRRLRKVFKNLKRAALFWLTPSPGELFVSTPETTHQKLIKVEFWHHSESLWVYFMYLNLPIVVTLFYGGYQMIFIDLLFIFFASKVNEVTRA